MTESIPGLAERQVWVLSNHPVLGRAIEAGLKSLVQVELVDVTTAELVASQATAWLPKPDLLIVTDLSERSAPAQAQHLAPLLEHYGHVPLLVVCEQPAVPALSRDPVHYLAFPFELDELQARVVEIMRDACRAELPEDSGAPRPRLLIVEDERIVATDLATTLESLGYEIVGSFDCAKEALELVRRAPPDLVLMDIHLKGEMDGIEAAGQVQAETGVPVIYLTAHADATTLERAKVTAPYGYILKPFEEREVHSLIQMALHRAQAERNLQERERWLRAVLRSIDDGVIATDAEGRIVFLNPVAEELTGHPWDEALGHPLDDVFVCAAGDGGCEEAAASETVLRSRSGEEAPVDCSRAPIRDAWGAPCGEILAFRDVSERVAAAALLRERAQELAAQNAELRAFAHTVAHDIKDPLNVIYGYASMLASGEVDLEPELVQQSLDTIAAYAHRTCNIVDELLLLAKLRDADIEVQPLNMPAIVVQAEERLSHMRDRYRARIVHAAGSWPTALGYGPWVEEVWVNFLSNGMKYGGDPPWLEVGAEQIDDEVRFWVRDNGAGIAPEDRERLFVPFGQLHRVRATGQGLGLSIVHRIVTRLGGRVGVESEVGAGSCFYFTLPVSTVAQPEQLWPHPHRAASWS